MRGGLLRLQGGCDIFILSFEISILGGFALILDCKQYSGPCTCGREHPLETKMVVVEYGALEHFDDYMAQCGLTGRRTVLYDTNTYNLPGMVHVPADKEIVLEAKGLHSEKSLIESIIPQLEDPDVIITVGSGTLMDFARYNAFHMGIPFVAIPTLASSDGFTANICSCLLYTSPSPRDLG